MKKVTGTILSILLLLAMPLTAKFYNEFDRNDILRLAYDLNIFSSEQRANVGESQEPGIVQSNFTSENVTEIEDSQEADAFLSENQMFGFVTAVPDGTVSLKQLRTQIEKMKGQLETKYLALVNEQVTLARQRDLKRTRKDLDAYNASVNAFNQRAERYEKMSRSLSEMVDEFNAIVRENNPKYQSPENFLSAKY
jgi:hypothetical protein